MDGDRDGLRDRLCPWCLAAGLAHERFGVKFADPHDGAPDTVQPAVLEEIAIRTPSYYAWQQERWLFHCNDGAAYLGQVGFAELQPYPDAIETLLHEHDEYGWSPERSRQHVEGLRTDGDATAYLFRCLHCGSHLAYSDMS